MKTNALLSNNFEYGSFFPKRKILVLVGFICFLLSGCLVKSLHPFYKPSDIVYRKDIIGTYVDQEKGTWQIEQAIKQEFLKADSPQNHYKITLVDDKKRKASFTGNLFKLDNNYYVDFFPEGGNNDDQIDLYNLHLLGVHTVAKVIIGKNSIHIKWYNEKWLSELFEQNKIRLAHEKVDNNDAVVLTASTNDLQKFMRKFANDPNAFKKSDKEKNDDFEYVLSRKQ